MGMIASKLQLVEHRIRQASLAVHRAPQDVKLLAVSKTVPAERVREAFQAGQRRFGENYVQEGIDKIEALADLREELQWHMIGPLQSNKTRLVAEHFDWVHGIDRLKIAQRLSDQRPAHLPPLQVCIQVNTSGESSKSGVPPEEALSLAQAVGHLPHIQLRGVMALPAPTDDPGQQAAALAAVRRVFDLLTEGVQGQNLHLDTLSMGMSGDLEAAIAQGSTLVRIGSAIFGERPVRS